MPFWEIDQGEAKQVATLAREGLKRFNVELSDQVMGIVSLGIVLGEVYATRAYLTVLTLRERRKPRDQAPQPAANGAAAPFTPEVIGPETGFAAH